MYANIREDEVKDIDEDEYDEDQTEIDEDDLEAELFEEGYNTEQEYNDEYYCENTRNYEDEDDYFDYESEYCDIKDIITEKGLNLLKSKTKSPNVMTFYLFDYIPGRFEQDQNSKDIILIKKNNSETIDKFVNIFLDILDKNRFFVICVVPSAKSTASDTGVSNIAKKLCQKNSNLWKDGTSVIKRKKDIPIKHLKERYPYYDEEYDSLDIIDSGKIVGENILLLDDISTKGQAISVVRKKLLEKGAKMVVAITLGKTIFRKPD